MAVQMVGNSAPQDPPCRDRHRRQSPGKPRTRSRCCSTASICMEIAIGSIAKVLGRSSRRSTPTRRACGCPDEPLMLVDRILSIDGEARSMTSGKIVTEHDVRPDTWYLDNGRIPTCVAVEAGQADLFLSGYLGIDFITKGSRGLPPARRRGDLP